MTMLLLVILGLAIPTWASENLSDSWDVLEGQSEAGAAYVARSPVSMSFELETDFKTGISIYVASPTHKYNYCSVSITAVVGDKPASINRHHELVARWIGKKDAASRHSFSMPNKGIMMIKSGDFIENLRIYDEVEFTYHLVGGTVAKNRVSLKGSSKAIHKACSISASKSIRSTTISRLSVEERIDAEVDRYITIGSCGSALYYRLVGNSLYVGVKGIRRDQEILQSASSFHWTSVREMLNTPPFDKQIKSGQPFYFHDMLCD